jgi:hypothetical protein
VAGKAIKSKIAGNYIQKRGPKIRPPPTVNQKKLI